MASVDRMRLLPAIIPPANADNVRAQTTAENNKRTERYDLRVTGQVDITGAGTGLRNRGSILAALTDIGFSDGGADKYVCDARLARFIAECYAPSALPATRLAAAGIQAAMLLNETVPIWMCAARTANPNETKYVEVNKQLQLQPFVTPLRLITRLAAGGGLVGTITNLRVDVVQVFDDLLSVAPWLSTFVRQIVTDVTGVNPALKVDLRGSRYVRGIAIQQDTNEGEVADIINGLVLRGDERAIYGDRAIPFADLQAFQAEEYGGALPPGYLFIDFARYGRLSTFWNPYEDTNARLELDVQPSVGNTGSRVRVAMVEFEKTAATASQLPVQI